MLFQLVVLFQIVLSSGVQVIICLVFALVISVVKVAAQYSLKVHVSSTPSAILFGIISIALIVLALVAGIAAFSALTLTINDRLAGHNNSFRLTQGLKHFWPVLLGLLIVYVSVGIGFALIVIPSIFLAVALFVYLPMVVVDNTSPWQGFTDSIRLTWGNWCGLLLLYYSWAFR